MMRSIYAAVTLVILVAAPASGQANPLLESTVRVWSRELPERYVVATVERANRDTLLLRRLARHSDSAGEALAIPTASISRLEVQVPREPLEGMRRQALLAGASGAAVGVLVGFMFDQMGARYYPRGEDQPGISSMALTVPLSAGAGVLVGGIGGAIVPGKKWEPFTLPP
jgi:hypothetical protein